MKRGAIAVASAVVFGACSSAPPPARPVAPPITDDAAPEVLAGKVVWHDLLTHDAEAARKFYGGPCSGGASRRPRRLPGRYWDITREGQVIGGVFAADPDELDSPLWLVSVSVPDVDGAVSRASGLGAADHRSAIRSSKSRALRRRGGPAGSVFRPPAVDVR